MSASEEQHRRVLELLMSERRSNFLREVKKELVTQLRTNEFRSQVKLMLQEPLGFPDKPYTLPPNLRRKDVWEKILSFVDDPDDLRNMLEVCPLFCELLEERYTAGKLLEALKVLTLHDMGKEVKLIPHNDPLHLRLVSRDAKKSFDKIFMDEKLNHEVDRRYLMPCLTLQLDDSPEGQQRLQEIVAFLESQNSPYLKFPFKRFTFDEREVDDVQPLRDLAQRLLELVGDRIRAFNYFSEEGSQDAYCLLQKWNLLLPNLEELTIETAEDSADFLQTVPRPPTIEPFPTAPRVTVFHDDDLQIFSACYLIEILRANPTIQNLDLYSSHANYMNEIVSSGVLHQLPLQVLSCAEFTPDPLFESNFNWPLTTFEIFGQAPAFRAEMGLRDITTTTLFRFINQFGSTLKYLTLSLEVEYTGGFLELPELIKLVWHLRSDSDPLDFMFPLKSLQMLALDTGEEFSSDLDQWKSQVAGLLQKFHVPRLFPAMRSIAGRNNDFAGRDNIIWESGNWVS